MGDVAKLIAELRRGCFLATFGPYKAMKADNMPISCVDYGVVSNTTGREVSRMWLEDDARFHASCSPENITAILDSHEALQKQNAALVDALENAKTHIENGVEFGFINMPSDPYDPAHKTLPMIDAALAKAKAPS